MASVTVTDLLAASSAHVEIIPWFKIHPFSSHLSLPTWASALPNSLSKRHVDGVVQFDGKSTIKLHNVTASQPSNSTTAYTSQTTPGP